MGWPLLRSRLDRVVRPRGWCSLARAGLGAGLGLDCTWASWDPAAVPFLGGILSCGSGLMSALPKREHR